MKQKPKESRRQIFSLRVRLVLLVAAELVASIVLAVWLGGLLDRYILTAW